MIVARCAAFYSAFMLKNTHANTQVYSAVISNFSRRLVKWVGNISAVIVRRNSPESFLSRDIEKLFTKKLVLLPKNATFVAFFLQMQMN